ncbi:MAG: hypothetical protein AABY51_02390 [Deltaproteobacteria bacterium]
MKRPLYSSFFAVALASLLFAPALGFAAEDSHGTHHQGQEITAPADTSALAPPKEAAHGWMRNPLIEEMRQLDSSFKEIVSAVVAGDGARVHKAIEAMHGRMERTQEAIHSGEVKIPKNPGRVKEFVALDKEFHSNLEKLARSAEAENRPKMLLYTKKLMDGCVKCHYIFKK